MPGGDGTGPWGTGGWCTPLWRSGRIARPIGRGFLRRGGHGRGFRWRYLATGLPRGGGDMPYTEPTKENDRKALEEEARLLEEELKQIRQRIEQLRQ